MAILKKPAAWLAAFSVLMVTGSGRTFNASSGVDQYVGEEHSC
jgi:hypothetical protein